MPLHACSGIGRRRPRPNPPRRAPLPPLRRYLLPIAIAYGAPLSAYDVVVRNFIPATIGNWIGGAVCVSAVYALTFGTPNKALNEWVARQQAKLARSRVRRTAAVPSAGGGGNKRVAA